MKTEIKLDETKKPKNEDFLRNIESCKPKNVGYDKSGYVPEHNYSMKNIIKSDEGWFIDGPDRDIKFETADDCAKFRHKAEEMGLTYSQACARWRVQNDQQ